jgi:hypothetical protein
MTDAANTPRTAAGRAHFQTFVDNQHHDNVDAAYECSDDVDRCDFCAQEADDIIAIEAEAAAPTPAESHPFVDSPYGPDRCRDCDHPRSWHPTPAERREALRELSRDADDLGIYVEPEGLDVLARVKHEETEGYGLICKHSNQHLRGKECGQWALRFVAEYDRLMRERQP